MARSTEEIIEGMDEAQAGQTALSGLTSTSQTAIYKLWKFIVAQCANIHEQLWDAKQDEIEAVIDSGVAPSTAWVRKKVFEFQYDATTPQIMTLNTDPSLPNYLVPVYETIDETKRIITRCCVSQALGTVTVTVAKNEPPEPLTTPEKDALQGYFTNTGDGTTQAVGIGFGGQAISVYSLDPDRLQIEATITYAGGFAATIEDACILAIENYISELGQNPIIRLNTIVDVLQAVPGFVDIHFTNVIARPAATPHPGGTDLVVADEVVADSYAVAAGYMIGEDTATFTLADLLTFTAV